MSEARNERNELAAPSGSTIFRCGWCGHPTDKDGNCIRENPSEYLKEHEGAKEELINGECCPHGHSPEQAYISECKQADGQGVHW